MNIMKKNIRPMNSIIFVHGGGDVEIPVEQIGRNNSLIASTPTCVVACVYPEVDGPTKLIIGPSQDVDPGYRPHFNGTILTPERRIVVDQVDQTKFYDEPVSRSLTQIRVWFSHPRWPEQVFIGIDP